MQEDDIQHYYAHGKLLLSGEYLVLSGAKALALPLKYGQSLKAQPNNTSFLNWKSTSINGHWFNVEFDEKMDIIKTDNHKLASSLAFILKICIDYRPDVKELINQSHVSTHLEFNPSWGWGSSSTLISLLSQWLGVHPYLLLQDTFGGSGYDIACATAQSSIIYQLINGAPKTQSVNFNPVFGDNIYFVYSGNKQSSRNEIARFDKLNASASSIENISQLTEEMLLSTELHQFGRLMEQHELITGSVVYLNSIKDEHFKDFKGYIKTLGAWGGDFMMVVSDEDEAYIKSYFESKHLKTIFKYNDIKIS